MALHQRGRSKDGGDDDEEKTKQVIELEMVISANTLKQQLEIESADQQQQVESSCDTLRSLLHTSSDISSHVASEVVETLLSCLPVVAEHLIGTVQCTVEEFLQTLKPKRLLASMVVRKLESHDPISIRVLYCDLLTRLLASMTAEEVQEMLPEMDILLPSMREGPYSELAAAAQELDKALSQRVRASSPVESEGSGDAKQPFPWDHPSLSWETHPNISSVANRTFLLEKFLDVGGVFTDNMIAFVDRAGIFEELLKFLTDPSADISEPFSPNQFIPQLVSLNMLNGGSNGDAPAVPSPSPAVVSAVKRSYQVMQLLSDSPKSAAVYTLLHKNLAVTVTGVSKALQDHPYVNVHHLVRVVEGLLKRHTEETNEAIRQEGVLLAFLQHIHIPAVAELVLRIIMCRDVRADEKKYALTRTLNKELRSRLLQQLKYESTDEPSQRGIALRTASFELSHRIFEELDGCQEARNLLHVLMDRDGFIQQILNLALLNGEGSLSALHLLAHLLRLCNGSAAPTNNVLPTMRDAMLSCWCNDQATVPRLSLLIAQSAMDNFQAKSTPNHHSLQFSSYKVTRPLGTFRTLLVRFLACLVAHQPAVQLPLVSVDAWRTVTNWFFLHKHNNFYHNSFTALVDTTVRAAVTETLKEVLVGKVKLLARMAKAFSDPDVAGYRQHIRLIAVAISETVTLLPANHYLVTLLQCHEGWQKLHAAITASSAAASRIPVPQRPVVSGQVHDAMPRIAPVLAPVSPVSSVPTRALDTAPQQSSPDKNKKKKNKKKKKKATDQTADQSTAQAPVAGDSVAEAAA